MNSNWFKIILKATGVKYGKGLLLKGIPVIFNKKGASLRIGENATVKSSFLAHSVLISSKQLIDFRKAKNMMKSSEIQYSKINA